MTVPRRIQLDSAKLAAQLDARWPNAVGARRASTDETHRLALLHPRYDGFLSLEVTARCDLDAVFVVPDPDLIDVITAHHRTGPLLRGQTLPIDLELHPGRIAAPATTGLVQLLDMCQTAVAPPVRLTLATDPSLDCVLAGRIDGPFANTEEFDAAASELAAGKGSARRLAARIEALLAGRSDPGWSRKPWRRR